MHTAESIIDFWYSDEVKPMWFNSTEAFDKKLKEKYEETWKNAIRGDYKDWQDSAEGCLALAIIFDQFPLNMFRNEVESFSTEAMAIKITKHAIAQKFDENLDKDKLAFLYMPLMHSEKIEDQDLSVALFLKAGLIDNHKFAEHHRNIVQKFGRFPHRNEILQRTSTEAEIEYLLSDGAFKG